MRHAILVDIEEEDGQQKQESVDDGRHPTVPRLIVVDALDVRPRVAVLGPIMHVQRNVIDQRHSVVPVEDAHQHLQPLPNAIEHKNNIIL